MRDAIDYHSGNVTSGTDTVNVDWIVWAGPIEGFENTPRLFRAGSEYTVHIKTENEAIKIQWDYQTFKAGAVPSIQRRRRRKAGGARHRRYCRRSGSVRKKRKRGRLRRLPTDCIKTGQKAAKNNKPDVVDKDTRRTSSNTQIICKNGNNWHCRRTPAQNSGNRRWRHTRCRDVLNQRGNEHF